jgi:hypothetical protein
MKDSVVWAKARAQAALANPGLFAHYQHLVAALQYSGGGILISAPRYPYSKIPAGAGVLL